MVKAPFFIMSLLVGVLVSIQLQSFVSGGNASALYKQDETKESIIADLLKQKRELQTQLLLWEEKNNRLILDSYPEREQDVTFWQEASGATSKEGSGVIIEYVSPIYDTEIIASELRLLLNALFQINVQAIAVNDERVLFKTPIISTDASVLVGNAAITSPFTISVLASPQVVTQIIQTKPMLASLRKRIQDGELTLIFTSKSRIVIPAKIL